MLTYELRNLVRSRWIYGPAGVFWAASFLTFSFAEGAEQALLSLTHWNLLAVPLVSAIGAANAVYGRRRFDEFLLTQPVSRSAVFFSSAGALVLGLVGAFAVPVGGLCLLAESPGGLSTRMVAGGSAVAAVFVMLGTAVGLAVEDRARGLGLLLLIWIIASVVYDALLLYAIAMLEDYPIEPFLTVAVWVNPVDAVRLLLYQDLGLRFLLPVTLPEWSVWAGLAGWLGAVSLCTWLMALRKDY